MPKEEYVNKLIDCALVTPIYLALCALRGIFLSCRAGAVMHNFIYFCFFSLAGSSPAQSKLKRLLKDSLTKRSKFIEWQRRVYTSCPGAVRHALKQVFARRLLIEGRRRRKLEKKGYAIPQKIMISLNTPENGCNLACVNCYAAGYKNAVLPYATVEKIVAEQEKLGIRNVLLLGGEPFLYRGVWKLFRSFPHTSFYVATNGTLMDREAVARLAELGNVAPMISLEGFEAATDANRGKGAYRQIAAAMKHCGDFLLPYTVTITVTKENLCEVTSRRFLEFLDSLRCCGVSYSCYVPVGPKARPELALTAEESRELDRAFGFILENFAMHPAIGRNGTNRVGNCYAAREYIHVLPDGTVEPCPFARWSDPAFNLNRCSILEVTASPLFTGIRELNKIGVPGLTACRSAIFPSLQTMLTDLGAKPSNEKGEETNHVRYAESR